MSELMLMQITLVICQNANHILGVLFISITLQWYVIVRGITRCGVQALDQNILPQG